MKKIMIAVMIVVMLAIAGCVSDTGDVTPSATPVTTGEPIQAKWIEAVVADDKVSIPIVELQENTNLHFKVPGDVEDMNFMAYEVNGEIFVRANVCPPCRSIGFSLQNEILICDRCATTFDATTGDGIAGACVDYPKESVPHRIEGDSIVVEMADLVTAYEKTIERGW